MPQQKQLKQPILTDNKNIFTYRFQPIQRLQPEFYDWWHKKFHVYQSQRIQRKIKKLRIFSFISQRQRIQPNFMKESIRIFIHTKQPTKHNPNNQNNDIDVGFNSNKKFMLLQLRQRKYWSIHI